VVVKYDSPALRVRARFVQIDPFVPQSGGSSLTAGIPPPAIDALIVAVPETAGSALYGMVDVLSATGNLWETLVGTGDERNLIRPQIVSTERGPFRCGNGIPIVPDVSVSDDPKAQIVIVPEIWLRPEETIKGRYGDLMEWLRTSYRRGAAMYSACSGSIMLAESGILANQQATSHWGYEDLFRTQYPEVQFRAEPNLIFADRSGRIVTAGGTTSWHDLAIHIISRHCSPGAALKIAKAYLLKWHGEGQLPYASLMRRHPHADAAVRACEKWLEQNFRLSNTVARAVEVSSLSERSLKRRFKSATATTLIEYVQRLRIEEAKRLLETGQSAIDGISAAVGYEETAFFRQLFKRHTGLSPLEYRRMFAPIVDASIEK
jgi:transcriptional regulator GlxA family with amidase domain